MLYVRDYDWLGERHKSFYFFFQTCQHDLYVLVYNFNEYLLTLKNNTHIFDKEYLLTYKNLQKYAIKYVMTMTKKIIYLDIYIYNIFLHLHTC